MPYTVYLRNNGSSQATAKGAIVNVLRFRESNGKLILQLDKLPVERESLIRSMRAFEVEIETTDEVNNRPIVKLLADEYRIVRQGRILPTAGEKETK